MPNLTNRALELAPPQTLARTMADKAPVWERIARKCGLRDVPFADVAAWPFGDVIFRCDRDVLSSTTKMRQAGFGDVVDSEAMFIDLFTELSRRKVLP